MALENFPQNKTIFNNEKYTVFSHPARPCPRNLSAGQWEMSEKTDKRPNVHKAGAR
jgi:hypothetical protein